MSKVVFPNGDPRAKLARMRASFEEAVRDGLTETALSIERQAKQNVTDIGAVDRGFLRSSIDHFTRKVRTTWYAVVFVGVSYGRDIEMGRRGRKSSPSALCTDPASPAFPPPSVLAPWVRRKLGVPAKDARSVAFLIGRHIRDHGVAKKEFLGPAYRLYAPGLPANITKRLRAALRSIR